MHTFFPRLLQSARMCVVTQLLLGVDYDGAAHTPPAPMATHALARVHGVYGALMLLVCYLVGVGGRTPPEPHIAAAVRLHVRARSWRLPGIAAVARGNMATAWSAAIVALGPCVPLYSPPRR